MTYIYHITSILNLPNILKDGGLCSDHEVRQRCLAHVSIAHQHIKDRRAQKQVPCPPGGVVADYIPFYFAPRSPMLYAIHKGSVEGYQEGQAPILHLVSSAEAIQTSGLLFTFTDGHAEMDISQFFTNLSDLIKIDWKTMEAAYWRDTVEDGDRKRRRQAEFLVYQFFPFELIETIGVYSYKIAQQVSGLIQHLEKKPVVKVVPAWYY
jgi:hypothetical protein